MIDAYRRLRSRRARLVVLLSISLAARAALAAADDSRHHVVIGGHPVQVELARSVDEKARGLGGRDRLAAGHGMLFVFDEPQSPTFWMLGMRFALDFVWIRGGRIVELTRDVPPAPPGATEESGLLRTLVPKLPVDLVLEVPAGTIAAKRWSTGDAVEVIPKLR